MDSEKLDESLFERGTVVGISVGTEDNGGIAIGCEICKVLNCVDSVDSLSCCNTVSVVIACVQSGEISQGECCELIAELLIPTLSAPTIGVISECRSPDGNCLVNFS